jgi:preprotein translocase subunit SecG
VLLFVTGDEISSPDGDPYEAYRILFDLTFFFFVIVILLAIIQGKQTIQLISPVY